MIILKRATVLILISFVVSTCSFGQLNNNNLLWSATRKLTVEDFGIHTKQTESAISFAQFSVDYTMSGFDFLKKNFNSRVRNYLISSASWIDTTTNVRQSLTYQQTLFDICEIYTRQFRKALRDNRKMAKGTKIVEELNSQCMADFAKRRLVFDRETKSSTEEIKQKEWESQIQKELTELKDFAYEQ